MKKTSIENLFNESLAVKQAIINSDLLNILVEMGEFLSSVIMQGNKLMICGNGGSAADAQHLVAEMLVRLRPAHNREGIPALALAQDTSTITACGNDFGYEKLFERMVRTLGRKGDVLLGITTSGGSDNIIRAMRAAREMHITTFGFLGAGGGKTVQWCDYAFIVPSDKTGRVQESHITAGHALMEYVEDTLLKKNYLHVQDEI